MKLAINSEEDAWEALANLLDGKIEIESLDDLELGDWVNATILIPGQKYDSALNTYMMQGWQDAQRAIYRSYALIAKGEPNARALTDLEKERLELIVKVKSGSSDQEVDLNGILKEVALGAIEKMEPTQITIVLIVLILTWSSNSVMRTWLTKRKEEKLAELSDSTNKKAFETIEQAFKTISTMASDPPRQALIERSANQIPVVDEIRDEAETARHSLVKHASQADATINGVPIPAEVGQRLTRETRKSPTEERKDGNYRVTKVDTTVPDGFRVSIENIESGEAFAASVQEVMSSLSDREIIREAEWSKVPVRLQINARIKRDQVVDAVILRADKFEPEEPGPA